MLGTLSNSQRTLTALKYVEIGRPHLSWQYTRQQFNNITAEHYERSETNL